MLVAIINHAYNQRALALRDAFAPHAETICVDSGSTLTDDERARFDATLPNVYYSGLMNFLGEELVRRPEHESLMVICSDITVPDAAAAVKAATDVFSDPGVGVYAPSVDEAGHRQMVHQPGRGVVPVAFVEGACFAARRETFLDLCPVDTTINYLGWGLDMHLGYLAMRSGLRSVVDHRIRVEHMKPGGYSNAQAKVQMQAWYQTLEPAAQAFRKWASSSLMKGPGGLRLLRWRFGGRTPRAAA